MQASDSGDRWNVRLAWGAAIAALAIFILYGLFSNGTYNDDDISHYLIARFSWLHPSLLWDTWGRPAFTVLYAPVALFGFGAARAFSAVLATLTCVITARVARVYGARLWWLAIPLTALQPEFLRQGFSTLTELTGALFLALALLAFRHRRWTWLGLAAGVLPLARDELLPISAIFGLILLKERSNKGLVLLVLPMAVQNILNAMTQGSAAPLLFPFNYALGAQPGQGTFDYADNHPLYYLIHSPEIFGWIPLILLAWGLLRLRPGLLHAILLTAFAILAIASGALVPQNAPAYHRYAATLGPLVGLLATIGFDRLWSARIFARLTRPVPFARIPALQLAGVLLVLAFAVMTLPGMKPFRLSRERMTVIDTARWFETGPYSDRVVVCSHVWFAYATGIDRFDPRVYMTTTPEHIETAPPGSLIIWDTHYSPRLSFCTPLESLKDNPGFRLLHHRAANETFNIYVFEKL